LTQTLHTFLIHWRTIVKISEVIKLLQEFQGRFGDIELYKQQDDGRSTWGEKWKPAIKLQKIWPKHPEPAQYYID